MRAINGNYLKDKQILALVKKLNELEIEMEKRQNVLRAIFLALTLEDKLSHYRR